MVYPGPLLGPTAAYGPTRSPDNLFGFERAAKRLGIWSDRDSHVPSASVMVEATGEERRRRWRERELERERRR